MGNSEKVDTVLDRSIVLEVVESENWREVVKYLKELKRDLRKEFEKLNECLTCPVNAIFCSEVERLGESYERALIATLMLRCFVNEGLKVVEDEEVRKRLTEVLEVTNDLVVFLNKKHELVHRLMDKCKSF
jgi:uncharacterized protein YhaN